MNPFCVYINALKIGVNHFFYSLDKDTLQSYGDYAIDGTFKATVELNNHETLAEIHICVNGNIWLVCDRSLASYQHPIAIDKNIVLKYNQIEPTGSSDNDVIFIKKNEGKIDFGKLFYDLIGVTIPMKKLHPRFADDENKDDVLVYSSSSDEVNKI